ncbi:MAG TPA: mechanosensitive ion channel domain-containing protein [Opitutaceae bacterium]
MNIQIPHFDLPPLDQIITKSLAIVAIVAAAVVIKFLLNRSLQLAADRTRLTNNDIAPLRKVGGWVLVAVTVVLLLGVVGIPLTGAWAVLSTILAMVAIGFVAVWSVLSNVSCTFLILFFRPFDVGDEIEFTGEPVKGQVVDLNFIFTTLRTDDQALLQIPNNLLFQKVVKRRKGTGSVTLAEQLNTPSVEA